MKNTPLSIGFLGGIIFGLITLPFVNDVSKDTKWIIAMILLAVASIIIITRDKDLP